MRFDDRLLTVLNQPAEDRHDAAVRWRQLVDLVARAGPNSASPVVAEALEAIRSEASEVDESLRAAAARAVAALPLPLGLLEYFATDKLSVSAPVLAATTLDQRQWAALLAAADQETRAFIETLHPDLKPQTEQPLVVLQSAAPEPAVPAPVLPEALSSSPSLHDVVERIERRRRLRSGAGGQGASGPATAASAALFRWECGPGGEIAWVDGAPRGAIVGRTIARSLNGDGDQIDQEVVRAFAMRAPFRDALFTIAGETPVAGEWKISGVPAFEPSDGRFAGYRGVALREVPPPIAVPSSAESVPDVLADPDSLRELVHEIKTPLNAIIGFAEIIEGQFLGPADRGYRERAAEIVRQARLLLTAIDDLDFAAKLHSAAGEAKRERVDLGALIERAAAELRDIAERHGASAEVSRPRGEIAAAVQPELADRLLFRLFCALVDRSEPGERLQLSVEQAMDGARVSISRPNALRGLSDSALFDPTIGRTGVEGGFTLRLARGLARIAGGELTSSRDSFSLVFPRP
ncbi:MAG TPA: HAMP domain-containing sensor histidine kinase [Sphingomicrobium sp.]